MRLLFVVLAVLLLCPSWSGEERLALPGRAPHVAVTAIEPAPADQWVGALRFVAGWELASSDAAFGGFSALAINGGRFTLLGDGGTLLGFTLAPGGQPRDVSLRALPAGPGSGWRKLDRDSEALARDPLSGRWWVGFERWNAVWRYAPDFARGERGARPAAMRGWSRNGGAEAMVRLADGRFLILSERASAGGGRRQALLFAGDPTDPAARPARLGYRPPAGYVPTDIAELPDGRLLILNRRFDWPYRFTAAIVLAGRTGLRPGGTLAGPVIARLAPPGIHDNFEGLAVTREGAATMVWLVSDDNQSWLQRSLLLKYRLMLPPRR